MTDGHSFAAFDEPPTVGRAAMKQAWASYLGSWPRYRIYVDQIVSVGNGMVAALGTTTGSHLALPDEIEESHPVIWTAHVDGGRLSDWRIYEPTETLKEQLGLQ